MKDKKPPYTWRDMNGWRFLTACLALGIIVGVCSILIRLIFSVQPDSTAAIFIGGACGSVTVSILFYFLNKNPKWFLTAEAQKRLQDSMDK